MTTNSTTPGDPDDETAPVPDAGEGVTETTTTTSTDALDDDLKARISDSGDQAGTAPTAPEEEKE